jgi:hypothetical protein
MHVVCSGDELSLRKSLTLGGIVLILSVIPREGTLASTTIEVEGLCRYTDAAGETRFDGKCSINWGTGPATACSDPADPNDFAQRYVLTFLKKSEVWLYFLCDQSVRVNNHKGYYALGRLHGQPAVRVLTDEGELFEFNKVTEEGADE